MVQIFAGETEYSSKLTQNNLQPVNTRQSTLSDSHLDAGASNPFPHLLEDQLSSPKKSDDEVNESMVCAFSSTQPQSLLRHAIQACQQKPKRKQQRQR